MMEGLRERSKRKRTRNPRYAISPPVRRRSLRHILQPPPSPPPPSPPAPTTHSPPTVQTSKEFNVCDPYSSAMDNVPLKDLFPNMKVRKRAQSKMSETAELPSPKSIETDESIRCKLRDSLAAVLRTPENIYLNTDRADTETEIQIGVSELDCGQSEIQETTNKNLGFDKEELYHGRENVPDRMDMQVQEVMNKKETQYFEHTVSQDVTENQLGAAREDCNPVEQEVLVKEQISKETDEKEFKGVTQVGDAHVDYEPIKTQETIEKGHISEESGLQVGAQIDAAKVDCEHTEAHEMIPKEPVSENCREKESHDVTQLDVAQVDCKSMESQDAIKKEQISQESQLQGIALVDTPNVHCKPMELLEEIKRKQGSGEESQDVTQVGAVEVYCEPIIPQEAIMKEQISWKSGSQDVTQVDAVEVECKPVLLHQTIKKELISQDYRKNSLQGVLELDAAEANHKITELQESVLAERLSLELIEKGSHNVATNQLDSADVDCNRKHIKTQDAIRVNESGLSFQGKGLCDIAENQMNNADVDCKLMEMHNTINEKSLLVPEERSLQVVKESQVVTDVESFFLQKFDPAETEGHCKRVKVELENIEAEDKKNIVCELAERVAVDIESELYRRFGGVNQKYKEKAQSLLFNLKDRSNPELRVRVLSGDISPENLCSLSAEQLASLSEWRIAKAEELAHMVVLTDSFPCPHRLVKKTHKGEFEVIVEKDGIVTEVVAAGSQLRVVSPAKQEADDLTPTIENSSTISEVVTAGSQLRVVSRAKQEADDLKPTIENSSTIPEVVTAGSQLRVVSPAKQEADDLKPTIENFSTIPEVVTAGSQLRVVSPAKQEADDLMPTIENLSTIFEVVTAGSQMRVASPAKQEVDDLKPTIKNLSTIPEVVTAGSQLRVVSPAKQEADDLKPTIENLSTIPEIDDAVIPTDTEQHQFAPIAESEPVVRMSSLDNQECLPTADSYCAIAESPSASQGGSNAKLPTIMTLDEFLGSKKEKELQTALVADKMDPKPTGFSELKVALRSPSKLDRSLHGSKDRVSQKTVGSPKRKSQESLATKNVSTSQKMRKEHKPNEKLWEGSFQLSGCQISPVVAMYKSGDPIELHTWPKQIEIKGRVRLDALEKFLQELRQSRTRAVMITACCVAEEKTDPSASLIALKEASNQYQRSERVGYAEPIQGCELYLFPGGGKSLRLLVNHGYLNVDRVLLEEGMLVGFVVRRRNSMPTSNVHKSSSHYFNANRHALSAQLDSPTRPNEGKWTGNSTTPKSHLLTMPASKERENPIPSASLVNLLKAVPIQTSSAEDYMYGLANNSTARTEQLRNKPLQSDPVFSWFQQEPISGKRNGDWVRKKFKNEEDNGEDLPPGFGPKAPKRRFRVDDVDDLPEYDFSAQSTLSSIHARSPLVSQNYNIQLPLSQNTVANQSSLSAGNFNFQSDVSSTFDQFNPSSHLTRSHVSELRPLLTSEDTGLSHRHVETSYSPVTTFNRLPHRLHRTIDELLPARMPNVSQPASNIVLQERKEALVKQLSDNVPSSQSFSDSSRTESISVLQELRKRAIFPVVHAAASSSRQSAGANQASSIWDDDDDMPEWCPPTLGLETRDISTHSASITESGKTASSAVFLPPNIGRSWQRMPQSMLSSQLQQPASQPLASLGRGQGILQTTPGQYSGLTNRAVLPMSRIDQFPAYRNHGIRPNESRRGSQ